MRRPAGQDNRHHRRVGLPENISTTSQPKRNFAWRSSPTTTEGAPHLARFSRDVGLTNVDLKLWIECEKSRGESCGIPHLAKNERDAPNFLYAALDRTACAPFIKERRMKFWEPTKLHRKSEVWGTRRLWRGEG